MVKKPFIMVKKNVYYGKKIVASVIKIINEERMGKEIFHLTSLLNKPSGD